MIELLKTYIQKHYPFDSLLTRRAEQSEQLAFNQYKLKPAMRLVMNLLRVSPWVCGIAFVSTFGVLLIEGNAALLGGMGEAVASFYRANAAWLTALNIVAISGLIGYGTNYIAIRMLFRPVVRRPIWGQGLIPGQKDRIIYTLAQGMHKHILSEELIRKRVEDTGLVRRVNDMAMDGSVALVKDEELREHVKQFLHQTLADWAGNPTVRKQVLDIVDNSLEERVDRGLEKFIFQTYKRYNRDQYETLINRITEELPQITLRIIERLEAELDTVAAFIRLNKPKTREQIMQVFIDLLNRIDITDLLAKQMAHFDEARLEKMIWEATNEQLLYIQYLGTVLGILGGLLIWRPAMMGPIFVLAFGGLYLLDIALFRLKQRKAAVGSQVDTEQKV